MFMSCHVSGLPEKSRLYALNKFFIQYGHKVTPTDDKKIQKTIMEGRKTFMHWGLQENKSIKGDRCMRIRLFQCHLGLDPYTFH